MKRRTMDKGPHGGRRQIELVVERIGGRGDGLANFEGRPVFVPLTVPGDRVRVRLSGERAGGYTAELLELIEAGPSRVEPPCPYFGRCGGCALQHVEDHAYADWKRDQVATALARAGFADVPVEEVVRTPTAVRRRASFAAKRAGGRVVLGFNERMSHWLVPIDRCLLLDPAIEECLPALRQVLEKILPAGAPLDLSVTVLEGGLDLLVTGGPEPGLAERETWAAFAEAADLGRLSWRPSEREPGEPLAHRRPVFARFGGTLVPVPPGAFLQASREGEEALVSRAEAGLAGAGRIADLFAGVGTFTFPLARNAKVLAVEGDGDALTALQAAARGGVAAVTAERRDLFRNPLSAEELAGFDGVLFDPPRAGAAEQAREIARSGVPVVIGVSCNPATFARDARTLAEGGYRLEWVVPVDQFLWSAHIELVARFRRD